MFFFLKKKAVRYSNRLESICFFCFVLVFYVPILELTLCYSSHDINRWQTAPPSEGRISQHFFSMNCFFREAKHPNIVKIFECISIQNQLAIVMEFMAGGNLKAYLEKNYGTGQGKDFTIRFTEDIGSAIEHLHSLNIMHRDVKPDNIFVSVIISLSLS